jgi:type VI secretion system protein ImpM
VTVQINVGLFGKVPNLGDFVERRIHPDFRTLWDQWLQDCMIQSHAALGEQWLDKYLVSPIWRFVIPPEVCGDAVYAGVLVPSVDRVGRYFPLTIVAALPPETPCLALLCRGADWFRSVEGVSLRVLEEQMVDIDEIDRTVSELEIPLAQLAASLPPRIMVQGERDVALLLEDADRAPEGVTVLVESLLSHRLGAPSTYWLTSGAEDVSSRLLVVRGLPPPTSFGAMLGGEFDAASWQALSGALSNAPPGPAIPDMAASVRSERGHVRAQNEDYATARPDLKLWAVADGMGGYEDGALASAAVCDALQKVAAQGCLREKVDTALAALRAVNQQLRAQSLSRNREIASASTVVLLIVATMHWACVWSGDSRLYRLRNQQLEQISRDHSVGTRAEGGTGAAEYFVTAGVGVQDELAVEIVYGELQPGDRFLLCSDGLYTAIDEATLLRGLSQEQPRSATNELMRAVLEGPARDNATAVVVFVNT